MSDYSPSKMTERSARSASSLTDSRSLASRLRRTSHDLARSRTPRREHSRTRRHRSRAPRRDRPLLKRKDSPRAVTTPRGRAPAKSKDRSPTSVMRESINVAREVLPCCYYKALGRMAYDVPIGSAQHLLRMVTAPAKTREKWKGEPLWILGDVDEGGRNRAERNRDKLQKVPADDAAAAEQFPFRTKL
jgi:hypothetical protein